MAAGESYSFCFTEAFDFRWPAVAGKQMKDPFTVDYLAANGLLELRVAADKCTSNLVDEPGV